MRIRVAQAIGFQSEPESEPIIGTRAISSGRLRHSPRRHTHANRATRGPQTRRQTQPPQQVVAISCLRQRPLGALSPHPPPSLGALRRNRSQLRLPSSVSYLTNHSFPSFHHRLPFRFCPNWKLQDLICSELATWLAPACLCPPWTPPSVRCYRRFVFMTFLFCLFVIFEDSFAFVFSPLVFLLLQGVLAIANSVGAKALLLLGDSRPFWWRASFLDFLFGAKVWNWSVSCVDRRLFLFFFCAGIW